jgi:hypothetical protein
MHLSKISFFLFLLALSLPSLKAQVLNTEAEQAAVRQCFNDYKSAALGDDYPQLIQLVDSTHSLVYYQEMLHHILYSRPETVDSLNIFDKLTVLLIRQQAEVDDLKDYQAKDLLIYTFKSGMVGKETLESNTLGEVLIKKQNAQGRLLVNTLKTPAFYQFYKVEGTWRIDITSIFPQSASAFKQMAARNKVNENTYILSLIESISGSAAEPSLWEPLLENSIK